MTRTFFKAFERDDGTEITVEYSITPYDSGVSSGPAEICYPPEGGEVEILKSFTDAGPIELTDGEVKAWCDEIFENHDFSDDYADYDDWRDFY